MQYQVYRSNSWVSELSKQSSFWLIGWSYSRYKNGEQGTLSKKEAYKMRYVNEKVEAELNEFKEEIWNKYKISRIKDFVFPRKVETSNTQYGK